MAQTRLKSCRAGMALMATACLWGIIGAHLGEEPVRLPAAAGAAVADGGRTIGTVAQPGGGAGEQLAGLQGDADAGKVFELIGGTAGINRRFDAGFEFDHREWQLERRFNHEWTRIHIRRKTQRAQRF